jgi:hypothetical protein
LLSSQPGIWHIEQAPGANIEKVITNHVVREIRFTNTLTSSLTSITNYVLGRTPTASIPPEIVVIPKNRCFINFTHFQKYSLRKTFIRSLSNIRNWLGHPELSFQSINTPSYFQTTFKVPFIKVPRSEKRLARIQKLSEPTAYKAYTKTSQVRQREAIEASISQYENMPRKEDIEAITFPTVASFLDTLAEYRKQKLLPSSFPRSNISGRSSGVMAWYDFDNYRNAYTKHVPTGKTKHACRGSRNRKFLAIEGTDDTNIVKCAWGNQLYFMKDGNDHIDDSWGDDIIYAGPGNDIIDAHWGNDLIFFNYGWGQDTINKTCTFSAYIPQDSAKAKKVYWNKQWPYKNFIVFGKDIRKEDMVSVNGKLVHKLTGDSITIKGDCFNLIYWQ